MRIGQQIQKARMSMSRINSIGFCCWGVLVLVQCGLVEQASAQEQHRPQWPEWWWSAEDLQPLDQASAQEQNPLEWTLWWWSVIAKPVGASEIFYDEDWPPPGTLIKGPPRTIIGEGEDWRRGGWHAPGCRIGAPDPGVILRKMTLYVYPTILFSGEPLGAYLSLESHTDRSVDAPSPFVGHLLDSIAVIVCNDGGLVHADVRRKYQPSLINPDRPPIPALARAPLRSLWGNWPLQEVTLTAEKQARLKWLLDDLRPPEAFKRILDNWCVVRIVERNYRIASQLLKKGRLVVPERGVPLFDNLIGIGPGEVLRRWVAFDIENALGLEQMKAEEIYRDERGVRHFQVLVRGLGIYDDTIAHFRIYPHDETTVRSFRTFKHGKLIHVLWSCDRPEGEKRFDWTGGGKYVPIPSEPAFFCKTVAENLWRDEFEKPGPWLGEIAWAEGATPNTRLACGDVDASAIEITCPTETAILFEFVAEEFQNNEQRRHTVLIDKGEIVRHDIETLK